MNTSLATITADTIGFDFTTLPSEVVDVIRDRTVRVLTLVRFTHEGFAEIGSQLLLAQAELQHGHFLKWIAAMPFSKSAAYRMMEVAKHIGPKLPRLGSLPLVVVQQIAAAPEPVRVEIVNSFDTDTPLTRPEIDTRLKTARQDAKIAAAEAKVSARERAARERRKARTESNAAAQSAKWEVEAAKRTEDELAITALLLKHLPAEAIAEFCERGASQYGIGIIIQRLKNETNRLVLKEQLGLE